MTLDIRTVPIIVFPLIGGFAVIVMTVILGKWELKRRKEGFKPSNFGERIPAEYTPKEKRFVKWIGLFMFLWFAIMVVLLIIFGRAAQPIIQLMVIVGVAIWGALITLGNKLTKK